MSDVPFSPAAERNKQPILERLQRVLPPSGRALEVASGTGQHAAWFAAALPGWTWQPTDGDTRSLDGIEAQRRAHKLPNLLPPRYLDVLAPEWAADDPAFTGVFDLVYCANMLHIAPWACCPALMRVAARVLAPEGLLVTYGPYLEDHLPTAPGNLAFDHSLRERNAEWGLRHLREVAEEAGHAGLRLKARHAMPANNLLLEFCRAR